MTDAGSRPGRLAGLAIAWSRLHVEQRVAAVAAILLIVSTLGPFSFVELAEIAAAGAVLVLLKQRADGREFHLPFGDGTAIDPVAISPCSYGRSRLTVTMQATEISASRKAVA